MTDTTADEAPGTVMQHTGAQDGGGVKKPRKPRGPNKPKVQPYQIDQLVSVSQEAIEKLLRDYVGKTLKDPAGAEKLELQVSTGDGWQTLTGLIRFATK